MPQGWMPTRLGSICKTNQRTYSVSEQWPFVNYLDTGNITENRVSEIQHIVIGQDTLPSRARRKVAIDDILYSTVRPNQRHYGIVKDVLPNMLVSTGFTVITADKGKADSDFLYYYLTQNDIVDGLHAIGEQSVSAYPSIKPSDIEGLELLLPPLAEQVEIGRTLRSLDDKIANNSKINHHLEQMAQAIFKSWFVDFEPFGGVMPDDWREGTLGDICSFQAGFAFPKDEQGAVASDIPFIKVSDMNSVENGYFIIRSNNWISNETAKRLKLKLAPIGAIVFAKIGEALKAERLRVIVRLTAIDNNMMTAIASSPVYAAYLPFLLEDIHLAEWAEGSALPYLRQSDLTKIPIVIPAQKALKFFSAVMKPIEGMKLMKSKEGSHLASLRDSLLPRLMSGELSVADLSDAK